MEKEETPLHQSDFNAIEPQIVNSNEPELENLKTDSIHYVQQYDNQLPNQELHPIEEAKQSNDYSMNTQEKIQFDPVDEQDLIEADQAQEDVENIDEFMKQEFEGSAQGGIFEAAKDGSPFQSDPKEMQQMQFSAGILIYPENILAYEQALQDLVISNHVEPPAHKKTLNMGPKKSHREDLQSITGNMNGNPQYLLPEKERQAFNNLRANVKNKSRGTELSPISSVKAGSQTNHYDTKKGATEGSPIRVEQSNGQVLDTLGNSDQKSENALLNKDLVQSFPSNKQKPSSQQDYSDSTQNKYQSSKSKKRLQMLNHGSEIIEEQLEKEQEKSHGSQEKLETINLKEKQQAPKVKSNNRVKENLSRRLNQISQASISEAGRPKNIIKNGRLLSAGQSFGTLNRANRGNMVLRNRNNLSKNTFDLKENEQVLDQPKLRPITAGSNVHGMRQSNRLQGWNRRANPNLTSGNRSNNEHFATRDVQGNIFSDDQSAKETTQNTVKINTVESHKNQAQQRHGFGLTRYRIKSSQGSKRTKRNNREQSSHSIKNYGNSGRPYIHIDPITAQSHYKTKQISSKNQVYQQYASLNSIGESSLSHNTIQSKTRRRHKDLNSNSVLQRRNDEKVKMVQRIKTQQQISNVVEEETPDMTQQEQMENTRGQQEDQKNIRIGNQDTSIEYIDPNQAISKKRKMTSLTKTGTLDQIKPNKKQMMRKLQKIQKVSSNSNRVPVNNFLNYQYMPGSGAVSFTNYQLNSKSNPYLAQTGSAVQQITRNNQLFSRIKVLNANIRSKSGTNQGRRKKELDHNIQRDLEIQQQLNTASQEEQLNQFSHEVNQLNLEIQDNDSQGDNSQGRQEQKTEGEDDQAQPIDSYPVNQFTD